MLLLVQMSPWGIDKITAVIANAKKKMQQWKGKKGNEKERQTLAGARTHVHTSKVAYRPYLDEADCFCQEKNIAHYTRYMPALHTTHVPKRGRQYTSNLSLHMESRVVASRATPKRYILGVYNTYVQGPPPGRAWRSGARTNWNML